MLRAALNDAPLPVNPAAGVKLGKVRKVRPLVWNEARVEQWRETGEVPSAVMIWDAQQCGLFLDSVEDHRLYSLFHVAAHYGLRRASWSTWPGPTWISGRGGCMSAAT